MNAVIFIRANKASELKKELNICVDYAIKSKANIVEIIYCNHLASTSPSDLKDFGLLLASYMKHSDKLDTVIVSRIDRITRSVTVAKIMLDTLENLGVSIQSVEKIQTVTL